MKDTCEADSLADILLQTLDRFLHRCGCRLQIREVSLDLRGQQVELLLQALDGAHHTLVKENTVHHQISAPGITIAFAPEAIPFKSLQQMTRVQIKSEQRTSNPSYVSSNSRASVFIQSSTTPVAKVSFCIYATSRNVTRFGLKSLRVAI